MAYSPQMLAGRSVFQLQEIYEKAKALAVSLAGDGYVRHGGFDNFAEHYLSPGQKGIQRAREQVLFAFGQIRINSGSSHFIPPSPETLEWGGFLGGEWVPQPTPDADQKIEALLHG